MKQVVMFRRIALVALIGANLAGCSTMKGWFAGKDAAAKKAQEPAELVDFDASVRIDKIWSIGVGKGEQRRGVRQHPVVADGRVYAAANSGSVYALDLQSGRKIWEYEAKKQRKQQLEAVDEVPKIGRASCRERV